MGSPIYLAPQIIPYIEGTEILDLGCGDGLYGCLMQTCWWQTISGSREPDFVEFVNPKRANPDFIVGVDIDEEMLQKSRTYRVYDELVLSYANKLPFKDSSFDTILCIEVLEHLDKKTQMECLDEMERCARLRIIISTPKGGVIHDLSKRTSTYALAGARKSFVSVQELKKKNFFIGTPPERGLLPTIKRFLKKKYLKVVHNYDGIIAIKRVYKKINGYNWLNGNIINILQCPLCKGELQFELSEEISRCKNCETIFKKKFGMWNFCC